MIDRLILFLAFLAATFIARGQEDKNIKKINELDTLIQSLILKNKVAGVAFGIQIGDAIPNTREYGFSDLAVKTKVAPMLQFRIASITKPFTATAILKLVEQKKLSLNDKLGTFFQDYPNGKNISIYQLLSHTSGIPNWWDGELPEGTPKNFPMCTHPHQYLQRMKKSALFAPGEFYSYSNTGYVLLGEIIEKISGKSYDDFLRENIFVPAGMTKTEIEHIERSSEQWVKGYAIDTTRTVPFVEPEVYHMPFAAGGLRSTVLDLLKFIKALNTEKIISAASVREMTSYALLKSGRPVYEGRYNSTATRSQENTEKIGYGLGFKLREHNQLPVYYHDGGIAGFQSYLIHVPKNNTTIVLLANTEDALVQVLKDIRQIATEIKN
jgi:CubicO group peptidase (beta-lactamase class C family)